MGPKTAGPEHGGEAPIERVAQEERAKLKAKAEFDKEQAKKQSSREKVWGFLNSSFGLFLLGSGVVGLFTQLYNAQSEQTKHRAAISEQAQLAMSPTLTEIDYRLGELGVTLLFAGEPIIQESRRRAKDSKPPLLGSRPPLPDGGVAVTIELEIEPPTLDIENVVPKYRTWPFRAVLADLRSSVALLPKCLREVDALQMALQRVEAIREPLMGAVERKLGMAHSPRMVIRLCVPETSGALSLENATIDGIANKAPGDAGVVVLLGDAAVLDELKPLTDAYLKLLSLGRGFRARMDECRSEDASPSTR